MEQTPNEKLIGTSEGAAVVEAQKRAAGTYKDSTQDTLVSRQSGVGQPKSTVSPFRGG